MTNFTKPEENATNKIWGTTAPSENIKRPEESYINMGWTQVKPPSEYFNWWMKKIDTLLAYLNQKGVAEWDPSTEYIGGASFVQKNGKIWFALKTNTDIDPTSSGGVWKDYLEGFATQLYADSAVSTLKNSLHKVATTGLASDLQGFLPFKQLSDVPEWIRETHTDNGQLYMRSPDGTQYRLGNGRLDFFNGDKLIFSVDPSGVIDNGVIPATKVTVNANKNVSSLDNPTAQQLFSALNSSSTKPVEYFDVAGSAKAVQDTLKGAAFKDFFDTGDVWSINYGSGAAASTGCVAATRDFANDIKLSLKKVATTSDINDTINSLPWSRVSGAPDFKEAAFKLVFDGAAADLNYDSNHLVTESTVRGLKDLLITRQDESIKSFSSTLEIHETDDESGYKSLGGGMIMQWCRSPWGNWEESKTVSFPIQFPSKCLTISLTTETNGPQAGHDGWFQVASYDRKEVTVMRQFPLNPARDGASRAIIVAYGY